MALLCGDQIVAENVEEMTKGQAERLIPLLQQVLAQAGANWKDLSRIAVGIGPGNFTGVRISVAAARGMALSLGVPAIGVSSLEAQTHGTAGPILSVLDARRDRVYAQIVGDPAPPRMCALPELTVPNTLRYVTGFQATPLAEQHGLVAVPPAPLAPSIARIAAARTPAANDRPAPLYLRPADAMPSSTPPPVILA